MPADYRIDRDHGCVFTRGTGVLTDADLLDHQRRLRSDPFFQRTLKQLADFRNLEGIEVTAEGVQRLADNNPFDATARRALVVDSPLAYGLARVFVARVSDAVRIFQDHDEAMAWLGDAEG